jgi:hypothetical protein
MGPEVDGWGKIRLDIFMETTSVCLELSLMLLGALLAAWTTASRQSLVS